jgi:EAL domain-containing protein (putative c-di-GMP-specific phosphodiesterase class I)/ActR/RegA family two-component response regulator
MTDDILLPVGIKSLSVLLVDDDVFMLQLLSEMLKKFGITNISTATDGKAALSILDGSPLPMQLLICDLNMPGMDGIEFFRHLAARRFPGWLIISSGSDTRLLKTVGNLLEAHHLRILDILHKPIKHSQLLDALIKVAESTPADNNFPQALLTPEEIRTGINNGQVETFFQPQISLIDGQITGAECLARWKHPTKGIVPPLAFISVAEEHGLIDDLTLEIFRKAMHHHGEWTRLGHDLKISVNVSMDNLERLDLPEQFADITRNEGVDIKNVMLEMTESRLMSNLAASLDIITRLRLKGFGLSIDDFGTGYSSMEKLNQLPFTELKVDRAFVYGAGDDAAARAILDLSVQMGRALDMRVVAEGAETQDDWDLVTASGCDELQGYVISKPMPAEDFINWKRNWETNLMNGTDSLQ